MEEPKANRAELNDGTTKSLIMSIGKKKIHSGGPDGLSRMMYQPMTINGISYCRRHLVLSCHLCMVDYNSSIQGVHKERSRLGLRRGGDPMLNERSARWKEEVGGKQMYNTIRHEELTIKYGKDHARTHPEHWINLGKELKADERELNDRFLSEVDDVKSQGVSQCCYWACKTPTGIGEEKKLLKCTGCGIAKYCCKEHQKLDWSWEHKGECTVNLPAWFIAEMEQDRLDNINGSYEDYKT